jgi:hypothetical protein
VARVRVEVRVRPFAATGTGGRGSDETVARRRGEQLQARGISGAPVRSWRSPRVTARGCGWRCALRLSAMPWAGRVWALPVLPARCPAERSPQPRGQRHQPLP